MSGDEHGRIIAAQAKAALAPCGFRRWGRSRVWLADRGFWMAAVEFQPSGFSRGVYLNVCAHWLWAPPPHHLCFNHVERVGAFAPFEDVGSFTASLADMAIEAAKTAEHQRAMFATWPAVAAYLIPSEEASIKAGRSSDVDAFYAGVAAGMAGEWDKACSMLGRVRDPEATAAAANSLMIHLRDPEGFRAGVRALIDAERRHFKLPSMPVEGNA